MDQGSENVEFDSIKGFLKLRMTQVDQSILRAKWEGSSRGYKNQKAVS
jgi:hypothetical protein